MKFAPGGHGKPVPGGPRRAGHAWRFHQVPAAPVLLMTFTSGKIDLLGSPHRSAASPIGQAPRIATSSPAEPFL